MAAEVFGSACQVSVTSPSYSVSVETGIIEGGIPYAGPYEVEPTDTEQVLATTSRTLARDIVIGAIPQNYGLITWDGSTITVS